MAEESFPRLNEPMDDRQWSSVTKGIGDGVLDERGDPYKLVDLSNVSNAGTITVDKITGYNHAILRGFYHRMDTPIPVSLPPVASETTYSIVLRYDPKDTKMPVKLVVLTSLPRTSGLEYLVLWTVTRKPNQLLTDATIKKYRPTISPVIQVDYPESLPPYQPSLFGTRARCLYTGEEFVATFERWKKVSASILKPRDDYRWKTVNRTGGVVAQPVDQGFMYTWGASLIRNDVGTTNVPTSFDASGATAGILIPADALPDSSVYFPIMYNNTVMEGRLQPDGALQMRSRTGSPQPIPPGDAFSFQVSWWTPEGDKFIAY